MRKLSKLLPLLTAAALALTACGPPISWTPVHGPAWFGSFEQPSRA
jgi:hypothetical protein